MLKVLFVFIWSLNQLFEGWDTLDNLVLVKEYDEFLAEETEMPVFSESLKRFEGQVVSLEGYMIPLQQSESQQYFVLSRFPYNNCFFCGNAGPETVAEVYITQPIGFKDAKVQVTGTLFLNSNDPMHLFFILKDADVKVLN